jgi:ABC-type glycerol-3-phosphate transport system substrate-binding protein
MGRTAAKLLALGAVAMLTTTACAGAGGPQAGPATQASVATTIPGDPVTLTLAYTDDPPTKALIEGFRK